MRFRYPNRCPNATGRTAHGGRPPGVRTLSALLLLVPLATCASPTKTDVSIDAEMPLAPGERIVLFPGHRQDGSSADWSLIECVRTELAKGAAPGSAVMDTAEFQDAMFPWFELAHAPQSVEEMDRLLSRPKVQERIADLNVRYVISMAISTEADEFPGMLCGAGYAGAGCLGVAWEGKRSQLNAIVWDLKTGGKAGGVSVSSSGESLSLGVIVPIVFIAYTEEDACEALAAELGELLDGKAGAKDSGQ